MPTCYDTFWNSFDTHLYLSQLYLYLMFMFRMSVFIKSCTNLCSKCQPKKLQYFCLVRYSFRFEVEMPLITKFTLHSDMQ